MASTARPTLILVCGLPGSGKTTLAVRLAERRARRAAVPGRVDDRPRPGPLRRGCAGPS
ncbi:AAA family ATPase [Streptomyces niveus]|uniref:AAA family ATPase n=1 Tax=Streptomyces niveus TaxID=193462 RepID=UPI00341B789C